MRLAVTTVLTLLLTASPLALARALDNTDIAAPEARDTNDNLDVLDIVDADIEEGDFLAIRATKHCSNNGKIKRVKKEYNGKCHPDNSKGFRGAHNCDTKEKGKSYLCVQSGKATCYSINDAVRNNFENGECFIRK